MESQQKNELEGTLHVENIGGITETSVSFSPGVTILEGRNATNRTSLLQGIMAALGGDNVNIKGDADTARVKLTLGDNTYERTLSQQGGNLISEGEPYLNDPELANLFAFLIESNEARQAVARGDNLRDIIMRPVDTDDIESQIDDLIKKRKKIENKIEDLEDLKGELPKLEKRKSQLSDKIEAKRAKLEETESELDAADEDIEETRQEKTQLENKLEELRSARSTLDEIRFNLETEEETLSQLKQEKKELESELTDIPETPQGEIAEIESQISDIRDRKQKLETEINDLKSVIGFNEEMIKEDNQEKFDVLSGDNESEDVTDQLLSDSEITCWTCGTTVESDQIENTVNQLRELSKEKLSDVRSLEEKLTDLKKQQQKLSQAQQERTRVERRLSELDNEIEQSTETIDRLKKERETVTEKIETIEEEVEDLEAKNYGDILDLHKEANQLEYELGRLESDREDIESEIQSIENQISQQDDLESNLADVRDQITNLRTKIERIEQEAIEQFNTHMETVLSILEYENLDRIWLENVEREVQEGRRKVKKSIFELHIIRKTESGTAYEDTIAHLSESEREVTGLVFALAGYLAHELYEDVPFMILDSLEAIDNKRIAELIEYFSEYTGYLFVALLPEDAEIPDNSYSSITDI